RLEDDLNFLALAKATPGYVGADLAALTGAAGVIAVKRIFEQLSDGTLVLPDVPALADMQVDAPVPESTTAAPTPLKFIPFANLPASLYSNSIANFLRAYPDPLTED